MNWLQTENGDKGTPKMLLKSDHGYKKKQKPFTLVQNIINWFISFIISVCMCEKHTHKLKNYLDQEKTKKGGDAKDEWENKRFVW